MSCHEFLKRPECRMDMLFDMGLTALTGRAAKQVETMIKYSGYIARQENDVEKFKRLENKNIPEDMDYSKVSGLRKEYVEKLNRIKPKTIGQAVRIPGMSMAAASILDIALKKMSGEIE